MSRLAVSVLALAVFAGPATACINDSELPTHEREFRSRYLAPATPPLPATSPNSDGRQWALAGVGGTLLVVAGVVAVRRARA